MAQVSLTNYDAQLAEAQRRQKLSEMLQEQANAPLDIQSYKGIQAPIPWTAVLAKALQGYAAGYQGDKASKEKASAEQSARQQALSDYRAAAANRLTANGEAFTPAGSNVPNPQFSAQKPSMLANLLGGGNAQPPPAAPMPPQSAPMPAAMPPQVAPMPQPAPIVAPQMAQAMPIAPSGPVGPVRKAVDFQSKAPTARELEDSSLEMLSSSNPYSRSFGQNLFDRSQTQLDEQRKLDLTDTARDKEVARMKKMFGGEAPEGVGKNAWSAALTSGDPEVISKLAQAGYENANAPEKVPNIQHVESGGNNIYGVFQGGEFKPMFVSPIRTASTTINVNTKGENAYVEGVSKGLADQDVAIISAARGAPDVINSVNNIRSVLDKNPMTGAFADLGLTVAKTINPNNPSVADTQELVSTLANQTLSNVKTSGLGAGQGFTEKDLRFLQEAKSGRITFTAESLRRIANLSEKSARSSIDNGNKVIDRIQKSPSFTGATSNFGRIEAPPSYVSPTAPKTRKPLKSFGG
jgi:hypothetical protein